MAPHASPRLRAFTRALLASTALVGIGSGTMPLRAEPLPTGGQVVSGGVTIGTPQGGALAITQSSQSAIVNWQGFSVGQGHRVEIHQPNAGAAILNRVTGATPSTIAGQLTANGQVYLVNPNGVTITRTGQVKAAGFVASSLGITDEDFKAGRRAFRGAGASAAVTNHGAITIGRGGYAALIGGSVANTGTISVPLGRVGLGSGERATLDLSGDGFLQVAVPTSATGRGALVEQAGTIAAEGGAVTLTAAAARDMARQAVNLSGVVEARAVSGHDGRITLSGDAGAVAVTATGRLDASSRDGARGGRVRIAGGRLDVAGTVDVSGASGGRVRLRAGEHLALSGRVLAEGRGGRGGHVAATAPAIATRAALIDASGAAGGGVVRVGGGREGGGRLAHAERVSVDAATTLRADATATGAGGDVVVWSDAATRFAGTITARGGPGGGDGGAAEVSSKGVLAYDGTTILTAARGRFGTLLLDPYDITITNAPDSGTTGSTGLFTAGANDSVLGVATLQTALATADVTVSTGTGGTQAGTITVAAPLTWSSGSRLTLQAAGAVAVNAPITIAGGGQLTLTTGPGPEPLLSFGQGASVTFAPNPNQSTQALTINGLGYTLVRDVSGLQAINANLGGAYALANDIDAANARFTTGVIAGGDTSSPVPRAFSGRLDGLGHAVRNLTISGSNPYVGLIGLSSGTVRDIGVVDASISGSRSTGGLVGSNTNAGTIIQSYATGSVTGTNSVGGLVGVSVGMVSQSYAAGTVTGTNSVGGLVGFNSFNANGTGTVSQSYTAGTVSGTNSVGGLVGVNSGTVSQSYAVGTVTGGGSTSVGGLVGINSGTIRASYYDTDTARQVPGVGNNPTSTIHGLSTAQLTTELPRDFETGAWANVGNRTSPYLKANPGPVLVGADGSARPYTLVFTLPQLQAINANLGGAYALANDIDAAGTTFTTGVIAGGTTSPTPPTPFSGRLDGLGHAVRNLTISGGGNRYVGLIGSSTGTVRDIGVVGGSVSGSFMLGNLLGANAGLVSQSYAIGTITASGNSVGGLVGYNSSNGTVNQSHAAGAVAGNSFLGGLVGANDGGTVSRSYASGTVSGSSNVGGLVGHNNTSSMVSESYASGTVSGLSFVGGLAGFNGGTVSQSYATGAVTGVSGSAQVGGLVGSNYTSGVINQSYATGAVSGPSQVGGLVGYSSSGGTITDSVWNTQTTGQTTSAGGGTGQTTAALQGRLPANFDSTVWATGIGLYPYLRTFFPAGVQAVKGTAYRDAGVTALASTAAQGYAVSVVTDGTVRGTVSTGANGAYYLALPAGTLVGASTVLAYSAPVTAGGVGTPVGAALAIAPQPFPLVVSLTIDGGVFTGSTAATRYSTLGIPDAVVATLPTSLGATGASFTLDQPLTLRHSFSISTVGSAGLTVAAPLTIESGGSLGLLSFGTLAVNAPVQVRGAGSVALSYDAADPGNLSFARGAGLTFLNGDGTAATAAVPGQALTINGLGHTLVYTLDQLDAVDGSSGVDRRSLPTYGPGLRGAYALANDIDAAGTAFTTGVIGGGYASGTPPTPFSGRLDGLGHAVRNLTINGIGNNLVGLIGYSTGTVRDIGVVGVSIGGSASYVGGLVGYNAGRVIQSYATGAVSGKDRIGGLVGYNNTAGTVSRSYATSAVTGSGSDVGGFVGYNAGTVSQSYATGAVTGSDSDVGGLVGGNGEGGTVIQSYATGAVSGTASVGGLVGRNGAGGTNGSPGLVSQSYATGAVSGTTFVGGLVGQNSGPATITASVWDTQTTGQTASAGGGTGYTTRQIQGLDPVSGSVAGGNAVFFSVATQLGANGTSAFSGGANGLYPYLTSVFPNGVQAVSGTAYRDAGATPAAAVTVGLDAAGTRLGQATTGANGYYYLALPAGTLGAGTNLLASAPAGGGLGAAASLTGATGAAAQTGFDLYGGFLTASTNATLLSQTPDLATLQGNARAAASAGSTAAVNATSAAGYLATGASFTIDRPVSRSLLVRTAPGAPLTVAASVTVAGGGSLGLLSGGTLAVNAPVQVRGAGSVALGYDAADPGNLSFAQGTGLTFLNGDGSAATVAGQALTINGEGYTLVRTMADLDGIDGVAAVAGGALTDQSTAGGLAGRYALARDLLATDTTYSNALVATNANTARFSGTFEGLGHTLTGLTIDKPSSINNGDYAGLFGAAGSGGMVRDLGLIGGRVSGHSFVGGLIGRNDGILSQVYATGSVSGNSTVGGLVGYNSGGRISQAYATGSVTGVTAIAGSDNTGGLVGRSDGGNISQAYATGSVTGTYYVGGLVGTGTGNISQAYATGRVRGSLYVGGLVGSNGGTITASAWDTQTTGQTASAGGATGYTTRQLQGLDPLPDGSLFSVATQLGANGASAFSGGATGLYPYLTSFFPKGVQAITARAQSERNRPLGGAQVGFYAGGNLLGGGPVSSGANGYVYQFVSAGTLPASGIGATLTPAGGSAATGAIYTDGATLSGTVVALDAVTAGQYRQTTAQTRYSGLQADLAASFGTAPLAGLTTALSATPVSITATGAGFTVDEAVTARAGLSLATTATGAPLVIRAALDVGTAPLTLTSLGTITQSGGTITAGQVNAVAATGLSLTGANQVGTVTGLSTASGSLAFINATGFTVGGRVSNDGGPVSLSATAGDLTFGPSAQVNAAGDATLAAAGAFVNNAGSGAVTSSRGRWLVYSADPARNTLGGLTPDFIQYNAPFGTGTVAQAGGNGLLYALAPVLTLSLGGSVTKTYDGTTTAVLSPANYTLSGQVNGDVVTLDMPDRGTYDTANVGMLKSVSVSGAGIATARNGAIPVYGYQLVSTSAAVGTITPATLTYTADAATRRYGAANPPLGGTVTGFVNGETQAGATTGTLTFTGASADTDAGPAAIDGGGLSANNGNYRFAQAAGNASALTITPALLSVAGTKTYDTTAGFNAGQLTVTDGAANGETVTVTQGSGTAASADAGRDDGGQLSGLAISVSGGNARASNYQLPMTGTLTITPAPITVTANSGSAVYGDTPVDPGLSASGLQGGQTVGVLTGLSNSFGLTAATGAAGSPYTLTVAGTLTNGNYTVAARTSGRFVVAPRPITITADAQSRLYGEANPSLTYTIGGRGLVNGDRVSGSLGTAATAGSDVGRYDIAQGTLTASTNYAVTYGGADLTITPRPVTLSGTRAYDAGTGIVGGLLTVANRVNGDTVAVSGSGTLAGADAGLQALTDFSSLRLSNANYTLDRAGGAVAITPAPVTVTANGGSAVYGDTPVDPGLSASGLQGGQTVGVLTGLANSFGLTAATGAAGSPYTLTVAGTLTNGNYTVAARTSGRFVVAPRPITITAEAQSRLYGEANPALTYTIGGRGLVNGDRLSGGLGTAATAGSDVGRYAIAQGSLAVSANYALRYQSADLMVAARPITITAEAQTRLYGEANPALIYTVGGLGLIDGDRLGGGLATAASVTSGVGRYAIVRGNLAASANYALTYRGADLTVTARPITVIADPQARLAGMANPPLTYTVGGRGLINGDRLTGALATTAEADSAPGPYPITQGSLTASANYRLGFVGADLTVLPAPAEPRALPVLLDARGLASTAERAARLDGYPVAPALPLLLGAGPDGRFVVADPRFEAPLVCTGQQGGCFLGSPVILTAPKPQASLPATAR